MSSSSSNQSAHAPAVASSSRTPPTDDEDASDNGLAIGDHELLADDPLHEEGGLDGGYGA